MKAHKNFLAQRGASPKEIRLRGILFVLAQLFALTSLVVFSFSGNMESLLLCLVTPLLLCVPLIAERLLSCRMNTGLYILALLYALGSMLGQAYKLYYLTSWWDKILHSFGGVAFAVFGWQLWMVFCADKSNWRMAALFAFCLSLSLAAAWEFFEFGMDVCFQKDMQRDTFVTALHSYDLGAETGVLGHLENIQSVVVNGQSLPGYLDGGLRDTMVDMILEGLGALVVSLGMWLDRRRHMLFIPRKESEVRC